jgi:hypothetical protein
MTKILLTTTAKDELQRMLKVLTTEEKLQLQEDLRREYSRLLEANHNLMNCGDLFRVYNNRKKYE